MALFSCAFDLPLVAARAGVRVSAGYGTILLHPPPSFSVSLSHTEIHVNHSFQQALFDVLLLLLFTPPLLCIPPSVSLPPPGKSYTMIGRDDSLQGLGIIPCAITWLFKLINERKEKTGARFSVRVSAVEVCATTTTAIYWLVKLD